MRLRSKPQSDATHSVDVLDRAVTALHVLGSVVQTVPVVGGSLKSATEIATDICETVKKMKENRQAYEQLADRATLILTAITNEISEADTEKIKAMEENLSRLLSTLHGINSVTTTRLHSPPAAAGMLGFLKKFFRDKGKDAFRASADHEEIKKFEAKLDRALKDFNVTSAIRMEVVVDSIRTHLKQNILPVTMSATLATLCPVISAGWEEVDVAPCMNDTRVRLLHDLISWAKDPTSPNVCWLNGAAGTGKSTVARTICEDLAAHDLLGASFFISRQVIEKRQAPDIIRTIAYQLAKTQRMVADSLLTTLRNSPDLASSGILQNLASELLFKSVGVLTADAHMVIVIDAFDECACDEDERPGGELLPILLRGMLKFPGRVKLLLTSRTDPSIARMLSETLLDSQPTVVQLHDQDPAVVRSDIRTYLTRSFARIVEIHPDRSLLDWPTLADLDALLGLADTLFVYATTIVRFVGHPKCNPRARLDIVLARREGKSASLYRFLDQVYMQVLKTSVDSKEQEDKDMLCERLNAVVGCIIVAQQPLSVLVHSILLDRDPVEVELTVGSLSALLLDTGDSAKPVRVFHSSFPDFIVNCDRCDVPRFVVSLEQHHLRLARRCLELLNRHLRYNMADLEDPDVPNADIDCLDARLLQGLLFGEEANIGSSRVQAIYYAAMHWSTHVAASPAMDSSLLDPLHDFCRNHLIHWLELLSLTRNLTYSTRPKLLAVIRWCEPLFGDDRASEIGDLLHDVVQIVKVYAEPIRSHALHAFHSVLPTMPHCRLLNTLAKSRVPQIRHSLSTPRAAGWGSSDVLEAGSIVNKVAYSPDGLLVFSSMDNGRLRVWSTVDFEEVAQLAGHKDEIWTLAISPNGLRLASGSCDCTVRIWDGRTFEELGVCEHRARVNWVAFSPDNNRVASASNDGTATIWNAFTFELVSRLAGHTQAVTVIYFFPDNTQIVSGSLDCTLRFWDAKTYEPLSTLSCSGPVWMLVVSPDSARLAWNEFTSRETGVLHMLEIVSQTEQAQMKLSQRIYPPMALDFSPDGALFATGTESGAVHIWNANDMSIVSTFKGHQAGVTSIAFSPDGLTLASGSHDSTVRISLTAPCEDQHATIPGHDSFVYQVAFSPDGSRLVSCSADHTVRIWDSTTCQELAVLTGHDDYVWAVAFSPDGSRVISGSSDRTIRVWDALIFSKVAIITGHQHDVNCVVFSPDGALIASCSDDRTVRLWDSSTHQRITRLEGHSLRVWSVAFSPAGTRLVSTSQDKTIRVWDAVGFAQLAVFDSEAHQQGLILVSAMFSLNSKAVLVRGEFGDGLAWVSEGEQDSLWTEVMLSTAKSVHPGHAHPELWSNGWLKCTTDRGTSWIWLPVERRGRIQAIAGSGSRVVIGGRSGAMNMLVSSY